MLTEIEQLKKLFSEKKYILIVFRPDADGDAIGSAVALKNFLEKQKKHVEVASTGFVAPKNLHFLTKPVEIKSQLTNLQKFIIKVDVSKAPIETLSYDVKDNWLSIYLTPKHGAITKNELRTAQTTFKYDLIITLDTVDLSALGEIFYNNTDLFYRLPVINIDHHAGNEHYGQLNLVDITAVSTTEIVFNALNEITINKLDADITTALLTGMIVKSKSFKTADVTPHTLNLASKLIDLGAKRDEIIHNIYRTKTISTLKLWGQALTHLQNDKHLGLVWVTLTREDFARSGAGEDELKGIVEDLLMNSPEAKLVLLIYENINGQGIAARLITEKDYDAKKLLEAFSPQGNKKEATIILDKNNLQESQELILTEIKNHLN
ncbi:MAG: DHH family phosphoesterase [Candidatus Magasanikbacteria bacterium]